MGENSLISWTDHTWNPWVGCTNVSPACDGCYAEHLMQNRMKRVMWGAGKDRLRTASANWRKPFAWNKVAIDSGTRPFVFCLSLGDFWDNEVDPVWRCDALDVMEATPALVYLVLSKRIGNAVKMLDQIGRLLPRNVALGSTIINQDEMDRDGPKLEAAKRILEPLFVFGSFEPLLGPVIIPPGLFDWIITGGETDQGSAKARPAHPDWFRSLRDQARITGACYHHKQNGEWQGYGAAAPTDEHGNLGLPCEPKADHRFSDGEYAFRVGKHAAGRLLDGMTHDARPIVSARPGIRNGRETAS